ncbi:unnamed protein product, partial [marine sediment metagenome]
MILRVIMCKAPTTNNEKEAPNSNQGLLFRCGAIKSWDATSSHARNR